MALHASCVPDTGHVVLPAVQTYSDGEVVNWAATPDEVAADDTLEPAPVLYITDTPPASGHGAGHGTATAAPSTDDHGAAEASMTTDGSAGVALGLSFAALVIGIGGAVLGALAFARLPKKA